jgi:hypothetical protein
MVVVTGIVAHRDPAAAARRLRLERDAFRARSGFDMLLWEAPGVLDERDLAALGALGLRVADHPYLRLANLRARVDPRRPRQRYGILELGD